MRRSVFLRLTITTAAAAVAVLLPVCARAVERYEVLLYGDEDKYVLSLQQELHDRGYLTAAPTGYYGTATQRAVIRYQESNELTMDGKAGPKTLRSIYGDGYSPMPETRKVNDNMTQEDMDKLKAGDEGELTKAAQKRLKELGYYTYGSTTGYFGPVTEAAVKAFQSDCGLKADGVIGADTRASLYSKNAKKASASTTASLSAGASHNAALSAQAASEGKTKAQRAIEKAKDLLGVKYRWGGNGPNSFDCSGFIKYVLGSVNISSPRTSAQMSKNTAWKKVERDDLKKGDLIFFSTGSRSVGHVGMYIGSNKFIHCSSGSAKSVTISELSGSYDRRYKWARRPF